MGRKVNWKQGLWTCLEVVLWELFQPSLSAVRSLANTNTNQPRQSSPRGNHHSWIGGGGLIQKKLQDSANWPECVEIGRNCRDITRSSLASHSLWSHGRQRYKAKQPKSVLSEAEQGELMTQPSPLSVGPYLYSSPQKSRFLSPVCFSKTSSHLC